jgi:cytochrome bd-type quinol oxidase subunit 1
VGFREASVEQRLLLERVQFAFTITYHSLFLQLTMGLALLIFILKTIANKYDNPRYDDAARLKPRPFKTQATVSRVRTGGRLALSRQFAI